MSTLVHNDRLSSTELPERRVGGPGRALVGVDDVAAHLAVGKESIHCWIDGRGLPARRVGSLLRSKLSEVDAWVGNGSLQEERSAMSFGDRIHA